MFGRRLQRSLRSFKELAFYLKQQRRGDAADKAVSDLSTYRLTTPDIEQPMAGREHLVEAMVSTLVAAGGGGSDRVVLPIVGAPGLGKTLLAKALHNDARVRQSFDDMRAWVYVSPRFDLSRIMWKILESLYNRVKSYAPRGRQHLVVPYVPRAWALAEEQPEVLPQYVDEAVRDVGRILQGRRCLVVLDDVWDESNHELRALLQTLPPSATVLLTTRFPDVASAMAAIEPNTKPCLLTPLLQKEVFPRELQSDHGLIVAKNCDGVPLLLTHAAAFVRRERSPKELAVIPQEELWQRILQDQEGKAALESAYASYKYLPSDLQKCFLHCALFPLDYCFDAEELADLFAAEGFLQPTMTEAEWGGYIEHLLDECFLPVEGSDHGPKLTYRMQKVLHIFAKHAYRLSGQVTANAERSIQHASLVVSPSTESFPSYLFQFKDLRTLILLPDGKMRLPDQQRQTSDQICEINEIPREFCQSLTDLRTLSLQGSKIRTLPDNLHMLSYLRYLNLSRTDIDSIPSSISKLQYLQTLRLSRCENLGKIDEHTIRLTRLRALDLEGCRRLSELPQNMSKMGSLVYLNLSRTGIEIIPSSISRLQFLQTLKLSHCERLQKLDQNTSKLVQLEQLDLEGCRYLVELPRDMNEMKSLSHLNALECSSLTQMPQRMRQLTNLETLLGYVVADIDGCTISELQSLEKLRRLSLKSLEKVSDFAQPRAARLQDKRELESLALRWNVDAEDSLDPGEVIERLQPNPRLETLEIVAYQGKTLPSWIMSSEPYLDSLVEIRLINLNACQTLPPLGLLPCLKIAEVGGAETITRLDSSFYGASGTFPSLEKLTLSYMSELEAWEPGRDQEAVFPCLAEVTIIQCPKLALYLNLPSVKSLILWMNNKMLYSSEGGLRGFAQSLEHVSVSFCEELVASSSGCGGLKDLGGVKELEICGCHEMQCLPQSLQHLSSLRSLTIDSCRKLETLPDGWRGYLLCN